MRGGLDDALDKLARRDELRRRAAGETGGTGTPPAVTELVEAIVGVVSRNPHLAVTVGVEGAGDPVLLHFAMADGVVQVTADNPVTARTAEPAPRHADFEIDVEEPIVDPAPAAPPRASRDDQDRFGPTTDFDYVEQTTAEQPLVTGRHESAFGYSQAGHGDQGNFTPHPFPAAAPPPAPAHPAPAHPAPAHAAPAHSGTSHPGTSHPAPAHPAPSRPAPAHHVAPHPYATGSHPYVAAPHQNHAEPQPPAAQHQGHTEPHPYAQAYPAQHGEPQQQGFPEPLPEPIPLQVERPEETEMAARRLAALLRSDPTLLDGPP